MLDRGNPGSKVCACMCTRAEPGAVELWSCIHAEKEPGSSCTVSVVGGGEQRRMRWNWSLRRVRAPDCLEDRGRSSEEPHQGLLM